MELDLVHINRCTRNNITFVEKDGASIAIFDKKDLLTGENKLSIVKKYFETGEIKMPTKNVDFYKSFDPDFKFVMVEIFEKKPLLQLTQDF